MTHRQTTEIRGEIPRSDHRERLHLILSCLREAQVNLRRLELMENFRQTDMFYLNLDVDIEVDQARHLATLEAVRRQLHTT